MPPTIDLTIAEARRLTDRGSVLPVPLARKLLEVIEGLQVKVGEKEREKRRRKR